MTLHAGDQVVSSGDGGLLPPGLPIGTVVGDDRAAIAWRCWPMPRPARMSKSWPSASRRKTCPPPPPPAARRRRRACRRLRRRRRPRRHAAARRGHAGARAGCSCRPSRSSSAQARHRALPQRLTPARRGTSKPWAPGTRRLAAGCCRLLIGAGAAVLRACGRRDRQHARSPCSAGWCPPPLLGLMPVYFWCLVRPDLMTPAAAFAIGILQDMMSGGPPGIWTLLLSLTYAVVAAPARRLCRLVGRGGGAGLRHRRADRLRRRLSHHRGSITGICRRWAPSWANWPSPCCSMFPAPL